MLPQRLLAFPVVLRPFEPDDAARVQLLAGEREVAETTALIPHPYPDGEAQAWIATHARERDAGREYIYAITRSDDALLVGAVGLRPLADEHGNIGYWIGRPYWGRGYATAAARAMVALAFGLLEVEQLTAAHLARNAASARVLEKCGLELLRTEMRQHRGVPEPCAIRGITRETWKRLGGDP